MSNYRVKVYGRASQKVVFCFCPFNIPRWQVALPGLPVRRMVRAGYQVVVYDYDPSIATISARVTVERFDLIFEDATHRLAENKASGVREFGAFGSSMGTDFAADFAARHAEISKVVLNLSYCKIAEHIIDLPGLATFPRSVWDGYIVASGGAEGMHRLLDPYSPINLVDKLADKQVLLYLAQQDRILQYRHTKALPKALRAAGCRLTYYENLRLGHSWAALRNGLSARRYMDFLADD